MAAIDDSEISQIAFDAACEYIRPHRDHLYLVSIIEPSSSNVLEGFDAQSEQEDAVGKRLNHFAAQCATKRIHCSILVRAAEHPGKELCELADSNFIDCLILGRRDLGSFRRLLTGSTSKYCIENARCNVLVVKGAFHIEEIHADKKAVLALEEAERLRRVQLANKEKAEERQNRIFNSNLNRNISRIAEENEKVRRMAEKEKERTERRVAGELAREQASLAEEVERNRRIREYEQVRKDRKVESKLDREEARRLEEEEQKRRMREERARIDEEKALSQKNLLNTILMEEVERERRVAEMKEETRLARLHRKAESKLDLRVVKRMEDEERDRLILEEEERRKAERNASQADRELVASLEEEERQRRLDEDEAMKKKSAAISRADRYLVSFLEEEERARRVKEEKVRTTCDKVETLIHSVRDKMAVEDMEEEERARRVDLAKSEKEEERAVRKIESEWNLAQVRELEEKERLEREAANPDIAIANLKAVNEEIVANASTVPPPAL